MSTTRNVDAVTLEPTADVGKYAVVVGISTYQDETLHLPFARPDADAFAKFLATPAGGGFEPACVKVLFDDEATLAGMRYALRTFLKQPGEDDLVILFFACHGGRDPERPGNMYLLPYDAVRGNLSSTGFSMSELALAIEETLHSKRLVVLADTCHSGGLDSLARRGADDDAADAAAYMDQLKTSSAGASVLTSAMAAESAIEGTEWGGHGVFTHFLLEGLSGKADRPPDGPDGYVALGELFDYVEEKVREATDGKQHPHIGAQANRGLVLAVTRSASAHEHLDLGRGLLALADLIEQPACLRSGAAEIAEASRLRSEVVGDSERLSGGVASARAGSYEAAEVALAPLVTSEDRDVALTAQLVLGLAQREGGRLDDAHASLDAFLQAAGPVDNRAPIVQRLQRAGRGGRAALVVALNRVNPSSYGGFAGQLLSPVREADAFAELLTSRLGFAKSDVMMLENEQASAEAFLSALRRLVETSPSLEALVVLFSGHGGEVPIGGTDALDSTLVLYDRVVTSAEVDAVLRSSRAIRTTMIASTSHSGRFAERATASGYEAVTSCAADQLDLDAEPYSLFMTVLFDALAGKDMPTARSVQKAALKRMPPDQRPQFAVPPSSKLFVDSTEVAPPLVNLLLSRPAAIGTTDLEAFERDAEAELLPASALPDLGVAWFARGKPLRTIDALARSVRAGRIPSLPTARTWCLAAAASGLASGSRASFRRAVQGLDHLAKASVVRTSGELRVELDALRGSLRAGAQGKRSVPTLVVAPGGNDPVIAQLVAALGKIDTTRAEVTVLTGKEVTQQRVLKAVDDLATRAADRPCLLLWRGPARMVGSDPALTTSGRSPAVTLAGLADATAVAKQLVAVIDADFVPVVDPSNPVSFPTVGRTTLLPRSRDASADEAVMEDDLTSALAKELVEAKDARAIRSSDVLPAMTLGADGPLFADVAPFERVERVVDRVVAAELAPTIELLHQRIERSNGLDPDGYLQLGLALEASSCPNEALVALKRASTLSENQGVIEAATKLQLGRFLVKSGLDRALAVSTLRRALEVDPELAAGYYWLGRAIEDLVLRERVSEAADAFETYLRSGAPLGNAEEVQATITRLAQLDTGAAVGRIDADG